ncbi:MAG: hypothetical protein KF889_03110 [Alphaproteobacteria bacterium]|nr:hypothetical protein [Alphaproteobacteria bacterium]MCW5741898.1 hypothetical protein [Alphaproteobacteria bacterium]
MRTCARPDRESRRALYRAVNRDLAMKGYDRFTTTGLRLRALLLASGLVGDWL